MSAGKSEMHPIKSPNRSDSFLLGSAIGSRAPWALRQNKWLIEYDRAILHVPRDTSYHPLPTSIDSVPPTVAVVNVRRWPRRDKPRAICHGTQPWTCRSRQPKPKIPIESVGRGTRAKPVYEHISSIRAFVMNKGSVGSVIPTC